MPGIPGAPSLSASGGRAAGSPARGRTRLGGASTRPSSPPPRALLNPDSGASARPPFAEGAVQSVPDPPVASQSLLRFLPGRPGAGGARYPPQTALGVPLPLARQG